MNRPHPGPATLAAEIGLAEAGEVALLPEIERRACDMFLAIPATASLPSTLGDDELWPALSARVQEEAAHGLGAHLRVAMKFTGGIAP